MEKYYVVCEPKTNIIYAGIPNEEQTELADYCDVTKPCIEAVRNHFLWVCDKEHTSETGYIWNMEDGKAIILTVKVDENPPEVKEKSEPKKEDKEKEGE